MVRYPVVVVVWWWRPWWVAELMPLEVLAPPVVVGIVHCRKLGRGCNAVIITRIFQCRRLSAQAMATNCRVL
jgi:hypothetical protein